MAFRVGDGFQVMTRSELYRVVQGRGGLDQGEGVFIFVSLVERQTTVRQTASTRSPTALGAAISSACAEAASPSLSRSR